MVRTLFIGATMRAAADARGYMEPVKLPPRFTNAKTIRAAVERKRLEKERTEQYEWPSTVWGGGIYHRPVLAVLTSAAIVDSAGGILWASTQGQSRSREDVATQFLSRLQEECPGQFEDSLTTNPATVPTNLFGFNLKEILRIAALEYVKLHARPRLPARLWHNPAGVYDPVDIILSAADRQVIATAALCDYLGVEANMDQVAVDCVFAAQLARRIADASHLI